MFGTDTKMTGMFAVVILLAFLGAGMWFSKKITAPLFSLVKQIESVTAGDYHSKLEVDANDEVGQVCDYFEHLSSTLRRRDIELARVTDLAKKDSLTGLYSHSHFRSHLEAKWKEIEVKGGSVILIDIDDFRMFNHAHGHIQGDLILKDLALGLTEAVKVGVTARYGGEEFVVWAPGFDQKNAFELAETIQKKIRSLKTPSLTGGTPFTVNCSLGVTNFTKGRYSNIDQFLRDADSNLVMAKKAGKNRIWAGAA
jgi:diguanylate cyclase (GGDEF)-like protein